MCNREKAKSQGCRNPDQSKGDPKECSPEQIRECHGDLGGHPCVEPAEDS